MKRTIALAAILAGLLLVSLPAARASADVAVSFSFFHNSLSPYGHWVTVGSYGQCWRPIGVSVGWQPYTVGHWVYTDYGWTWVSADPWGDLTYRYGTWTFSRAYGWVWVPGFVWAPAWVTWSFTNDFIGWAPLPPTFSFAVVGYYGSPVYVPRSRYCFVPARQFVSTNVVNVRVPVRQNGAILARSQRVTRFPVSDGVVQNQGPSVTRIEKVARRSIPRASSREVGLAPTRVETARVSRASTRRIAVAAPASAKRLERESRAVAAPERRPAPKASTSRAPRATSKEKAARPSTSGTSAPAVRRAPETRQKAVVSEKPQSQPRPVTSSRSAPAQLSRKSRPPEAVSAPPARRPAQSSERRVSAASRGSEKSRAVRASAPPSGQRGSAQKVKHGTAKKPKPPARQESREKPR